MSRRKPRPAPLKTAYVNWTLIAGATGYRVYCGTTTNIYSYTQDVAGNMTSAAVPNLKQGTKYFFAAKAKDATTMSPYSNEVIYTP